MRRVVLCLLLVGCGHPSNDEPASPSHTDFVGASGIEVSYDSDVPKTDPNTYENEFLSARECMLANGYISQSYEGPVVRVVSFHPNGYDGWTDFTSGQITLYAYSDLLRHESIHYLLWVDGFDNAKNSNHQHPAFNKCDVILNDTIAIPISP